jgi:hypothetical protein
MKPLSISEAGGANNTTPSMSESVGYVPYFDNDRH